MIRTVKVGDEFFIHYYEYIVYGYICGIYKDKKYMHFQAVYCDNPIYSDRKFYVEKSWLYRIVPVKYIPLEERVLYMMIKE